MKPSDVKTIADAKKIIEERDAEFVTIGSPDLQGFLRGKAIARAKVLSALDNGYGLPGVIFALDPADALLDVSGLNDPGADFDDSVARIIPETCREIPWEPAARNLFFLAQFEGAVRERCCPRAVYQRVAERAASMGFRPFHSSELEFTLFDETSRSAFDKGYSRRRPSLVGFWMAARWLTGSGVSMVSLPALSASNSR